MLEGLAGDQDIDALGLYFSPGIGVGKNEIDVRAGLQVDTDVTPGWPITERAIRSVVIATAEIENGQRLVPERAEVIPGELGHLIERALMHDGRSVFFS